MVRVLAADAHGNRRAARACLDGVGGGELDEVADTNVGLRGDARDVAAVALETETLGLSTFIGEDERPVTGAWEAVVEGGSDRCPSGICAFAVCGELLGEGLGDLGPDGWACGCVLCVAAKDVVKQAEDVQELPFLYDRRWIGDYPACFLSKGVVAVVLAVSCAGSH